MRRTAFIVPAIPSQTLNFGEYHRHDQPFLDQHGDVFSTRSGIVDTCQGIVSTRQRVNGNQRVPSKLYSRLYVVMYVRVKREKLCIFVLTEASESILEIKAKLQRHLDKVRLAAT